ncbi:hypothetical protein AeMF1_001669 [Aphanomyces euteiches]|nr:hypothetical protein AeMF1_001669 [Aphanomyces euteiches]
MKFVWLSILAVAGSAWAACNSIQANTDFEGNDLDSVAANSATECCAPCQSNPLCSGFAFADGVCYLKFGQLTRITKAGVSTATVRASQCLPWEENVDYYGNDLAKDPSITTPGECCDLCAANSACKLYVVSIYGCTLKTAGTDRRPNQDPSWNVKAAFVPSTQTTQSQCGAVTKDVDYPGNDIVRYTNVTDADQCCTLCSQDVNCKLYVSSIYVCSLKSAAGTASSIAYTAWNVRTAFKTTATTTTAAPVTVASTPLVDGTYSPDVRVADLQFTTVAGSQWVPYGKTESTEDDIAALVKALNITLSNEKHGAKPEVIITTASDGSKILPFTSVASVASVGECAALVRSHNATFFTYVADASTCLGHQFSTSTNSFALKANNKSFEFSAIPSTLSTCVVARFTDKCALYAPAAARSSSVVAGWVFTPLNANPVANLPTFANATKVAFYVVAHEDDHELFMSNNYHVSVNDSKTKVVFVYTTAGDDSLGDAWRRARELGTLAATKAWVDHVGKFKSDPTSDVVTINGHKIARVTIGNCVHYFMRVPEYGADGASGFMALVNDEKPVVPMDDTANYYQNRDDLKTTLAGIITKEATGFTAIGMNAQDPKGEQPDHDMHLATGALVYDIVNDNAKWKICVPQKYFYDYQTWNDDVNVIPEVETLQRYAWLRLSQAIYAYDATILFWSEHAINLGRTYIRRSIDASASSC